METPLFEVVTIVVGTAVVTTSLTSVVLLTVGRRMLESFLHHRLEPTVEALLPRIRSEVEAGVTSAAESALPAFRQGIGDSVRDAGDGLLPLLREQVKQGILDGVRESVSTEGLSRAGEELARRGASAVEAGLGLLFGLRPKPEDPTDS
jgi:hypothetical protein